MRLAVSSVVAQIRQGAGNSTAASASMAVRNIKLSLASERSSVNATSPQRRRIDGSSTHGDIDWKTARGQGFDFVAPGPATRDRAALGAVFNLQQRTSLRHWRGAKKATAVPRSRSGATNYRRRAVY